MAVETTDKPAEKAPEKKADSLIDTGGDKPAEKTGDKPAEKTTDKPAEKPAEKSGDKSGDKPDADGQVQKELERKDGEQPKAPDKYALKLPTETGDYLDESDLTTIEAAARAKGWTNDQAQAALDEYADGLATQSASFRTETEQDQTYGGEHLADTQRLARLALDKVRPATTEQGKALRRLLTKTGYGNNLKIVSFLADIGKLMAEDSPGGAGHGAGAGAKSTADLFYGATSKGE